ncbi:MAG: 16S rRNA (guanine(527)-N(7))-methyltransferase RsmG [Thermodesulfovibrionales bacterium]|nr:16S rRNA (guanine(527)-N(7))-methyltransferase RsmG [Thermodesulfovibrionales bacterium]
MEPRELLLNGLSELGVETSDAQVEKLLVYLSELKRWNRAYSLTSIKTDEGIVVKHFLDSALYLKVIPPEIKSIADIGAGAGFPGVVLKILRPHLEVILVEPVRKKDTFLRNLISRLKLDGISTLRSRVEDVDDLEVDAVCTRALFSVKELVKQAGHIVKPGGLFILNKGPKGKDELAEADEAGIAYEEVEVMLPKEGATRKLIIVRNEKEAN